VECASGWKENGRAPGISRDFRLRRVGRTESGFFAISRPREIHAATGIIGFSAGFLSPARERD
jgi:hypothetical protein